MKFNLLYTSTGINAYSLATYRFIMDQIRLEKTHEILERSMDLMEKINEQIVDDGIIARDEIDLFHIIEENLEKYQNLLQEILEDDKVTEEEVEKMLKFEENLNNAVQEQAINDGRISVPEKELINKLFDNLKLIGSPRDFRADDLNDD